MLDTQLCFAVDRMIQVYLNNFQQFLKNAVSSHDERLGRQELIDLLLRAQTPESIATCIVDEIFRRLDRSQDYLLFIEDVKRQIPYLGQTMRSIVEQILESFIHTFQQTLQKIDSYQEGTIDHHELINALVQTNCMPYHIAERITNEVLYNIEMNGNGRISINQAQEQIIEIADRCINARAIVEQIIKIFTRNFNDRVQPEDSDRQLTQEELVKAIAHSFRNAPRYYAEQMAKAMFSQLGKSQSDRISFPEASAQIPQIQYHLVAAVDYITRVLMDNFQTIIRESPCNRSGTISRGELLNCLLRVGMSSSDAHSTADDIFSSFDRDRHQYLSLQEVAIELPNQGWRCIYPLR